MPDTEYIAEQGPKLWDALKDVSLQLKWVTGAGRTPAQQKALECARQVLEENGQRKTARMSGLSIDATAQAGGPADGRVFGATLRLAMSGDRERVHYALARQHVADAEARIVRQREILEALRAAGRVTSEAQRKHEAMLRLLEVMQVNLRLIEAALSRDGQ